MSGSRWRRLHIYHLLEGLEKEKKTQSQCEGSVGSLISTGHGPTKVNIYKGIFLLLQGLLMCGEKGSKILTNY